MKKKSALKKLKKDLNYDRYEARHDVKAIKSIKKKKSTRDKIKEVMREWEAGDLHMGSPTAPVVTKKKQAIAIALSEARRKNKKRKP